MNETASSGEKNSQRYLSLDVLRGLTIALMVIVNSPGSWEAIYDPFKHASWHGFTITDMVFPSFLFVVGNAMSFTMGKFSRENNNVFLTKVFKRTLIIFMIGLFLNTFPFVRLTESGEYTVIDFTAIRIFGVLQRIALCYCAAALVLHYFNTRGAIFFSLAALFGYWALMYFFGESGDPYSLSGNAAVKLDLWLLNPANLYKGEGVPFDPEGILSTLPAIVNVIGGYFVGKQIQKFGNTKATVRRLIYAGVTLVALGLFWDMFFPINKKIWTSSYVLLTVGLNVIAIAFLILIVELANLKRWTYFFEVFGRNPLILYALSGMIVRLMALVTLDGTSLKPWIYNNVFLSFANPKNASLMYAIWYMLLIWSIGYFMDRKKIYIRA